MSMETLQDPGRRFVQKKKKKAFVEDWVFVSGDSSDGQTVMDFPVLHSTDHSDCIPETPRVSKEFDSLPWEPTRPQDKAYVWERIEAPQPPLQPRPECNLIHPRQLSPFPERLVLPFSHDENLVRLRRNGLLRNRSLDRVGQDGPSRGLCTSHG